MQQQRQVEDPPMTAGSGDPGAKEEKKSVLKKVTETAKKKVKKLGDKLKHKGHSEGGEETKRELVDQSPPGNVEEEEEEYEEQGTPSPIKAPASDTKDLDVPLDEMALMEQKKVEEKDHEGSGAGRGLGENLAEGLPSKTVAEQEPNQAPPGVLQAVPTEYHYKDEGEPREEARDVKAAEPEQRYESQKAMDEGKAGDEQLQTPAAETEGKGIDEQPQTPAPTPEQPQSPAPTTEGESIFASKDGKSPDLSKEDVQALSSSNLYTGEPDIKSSKDNAPASESRDIETKDVKEEPAVEAGDKGTDFFENQSHVMTSEGARDMDMPPSSMSSEVKDTSEKPSEEPARTDEEPTESSRDMDIPPSSMSSEEKERTEEPAKTKEQATESSGAMGLIPTSDVKDVNEPEQTESKETPSIGQATEVNEPHETSLGSESTNIESESEGPSSEQARYGGTEPTSEERNVDVPYQSNLGENENKERTSEGRNVDAPGFTQEDERREVPSEALDTGFSSSKEEPREVSGGEGTMEAKSGEQQLKEQETPSAESKLEDESAANVNTPSKDFSEENQGFKQETEPPKNTDEGFAMQPEEKGFSDAPTRETEPSKNSDERFAEAPTEMQPPKNIEEKGFTDAPTDVQPSKDTDESFADAPTEKEGVETAATDTGAAQPLSDEGREVSGGTQQPSEGFPQKEAAQPQEEAPTGLSTESKQPEGKVGQEEDPSKENQAPNTPHEQPGLTSRFMQSIATKLGYSSPSSSPKAEQERIVDQKAKDVA